MSETKSPRSAAQSEAARINSRLSTGPRTPEGKQASSRNAFKHGFSTISQSTLSERHVEILFEAHRAYDREFDPQGILECDLVRRIADESVRIRLIEDAIEGLKLQGMAAARQSPPPSGSIGSREDAFVVATEDPEFQRRLGLFIRYKSSAERSFYRALDTLRQLQKERREAVQAKQRQQDKWSAGFVSQSPVKRVSRRSRPVLKLTRKPPASAPQTPAM